MSARTARGASIKGIALARADSAREYASQRVSPEQDDGGELCVVKISDIEHELQQRTPAQVLTMLKCTDEHLHTVSTADVRCGLVSYRQEEQAHGEYAGLTMDGAAFIGILSAAKQIGLEALWLDAWCYRFTGVYDHADFCTTLHEVMSKIEAVVWLPRTRIGSKGEYAYRLWCTFEAACVRQRGLRVAIAGAGLSGFQRRVLRYGSFTPAPLADGVLDALCRLNLCFYVAQVVTLFAALVNIVVGATVPGGSRWSAAIMYVVFLILYNPLMWFVFRATIGQQVRLARNASRVLRAMTSAARDWGGHVNVQSDHSLLKLLQDLPWLPARDRRDTLVVQDLLGRIRPDLKLNQQAVQALAFSAYHAARLHASSADRNAYELPCREWLSEKAIVIDGRMSWTDGSGDAAPETPSSECIRLSELRQIGWTVAPGVSCSLISPLGAIATLPPKGGRWRVAAAERIPRARFGAIGAFFFSIALLVTIAETLVMVLNKTGCISQGARLWGVAAAQAVGILPFLAIEASMLRADVVTIRQGRVPMPLLVSSSMRGSCTIVMVLAPIFALNLFLLHGDSDVFVADLERGNNATNTAFIACDVARITDAGLQNLLVDYQVILLFIHVATCFARGARARQGYLG